MSYKTGSTLAAASILIALSMLLSCTKGNYEKIPQAAYFPLWPVGWPYASCTGFVAIGQHKNSLLSLW